MRSAASTSGEVRNLPPSGPASLLTLYASLEKYRLNELALPMPKFRSQPLHEKELASQATVVAAHLSAVGEVVDKGAEIAAPAHEATRNWAGGVKG